MHDDMIDRLVHSLEQNVAVNRRPLYRRLRSSLESELNAASPALPMREICARRMALETAIQRHEVREFDRLRMPNTSTEDTTA